MKYITFAIPCYNSEPYLAHCLDSILVLDNDIEIIVVNDGSTDNTLAIAKEYQKKYPEIIKIIDKENGGHGSGVNAGLDNATGLYYKVVDSDDSLDKDSLIKLYEVIKGHVKDGIEADLYIANFIYDHVVDNTFYVSEYRKVFPVNQFFTWEDTKPLRLWKMLLMHSLLYKTDKLRSVGMRLPHHTFYVDNIYAYIPLPKMEKLYYLDVNLYKYFIGRADQSVAVDNMIKRYKNQMTVMVQMLNAYSYDDIKKMGKRMKTLALHILKVIMVNTMFFTCAKSSKERKADYKKMWSDLKARDPKLYHKLRLRTALFWYVYMPFRLRGLSLTIGYKILCKYVKLGL